MMDREDDEPPSRRISIHGVLLPLTCPSCGGMAFEASTTPGAPEPSGNLPLLRCLACQCTYTYNRQERRWDAGTAADAPRVFVQLDDVDPYMAQWD